MRKVLAKALAKILESALKRHREEFGSTAVELGFLLDECDTIAKTPTPLIPLEEGHLNKTKGSLQRKIKELWGKVDDLREERDALKSQVASLEAMLESVPFEFEEEDDDVY